MSDLIQSLAEQARVSIAPDTLGVTEWIEQYNRRLAELIVEECARIADRERPNSLGCGYITKTKGQEIREHFGVGAK